MRVKVLVIQRSGDWSKDTIITTILWPSDAPRKNLFRLRVATQPIATFSRICRRPSKSSIPQKNTPYTELLCIFVYFNIMEQ